jgi:GNAT superfamily N-acetyltransferase
MPVIRATTFADVMAVLPLAKRMHAESIYGTNPKTKFDEDVLGGTLWGLVTNPDDGALFIAHGQDGKPVGFKFGTAHRLYFSRARVAQEMALWVAPEARGGFTCAALIKAFERWAASVGAVEVVIGVAANIDNDLTSKIYERLGYVHRGPILKKSIGETRHVRKSETTCPAA